MSPVLTALLFAFRKYVVDGLPSSGVANPSKDDIETFGRLLETALADAAGNLIAFETEALRDADTGQADGQLAYVWNNNGDPADPANGVFQWDDGEGDWVAADWYFQSIVDLVVPLAAEAVTPEALAAIAAARATALSDIGLAGDAEEALIAAFAAARKAELLQLSPSQGPYNFAHASALPRGITGVTSLAGGSGGANGTFTGSASGGSFTGVEFTFVVSGGALTSVTFTNGGINLTGGTTVPTLSFAASAGLTGASAVAVASPKVATQGTYLAASADGKALYLWRNDGTSTPAPVLDANGYQVAYISKSGFDAVFDQTVVTESGWIRVETDKDGLILGGYDDAGYFHPVQAILPATRTFTDDDLTTPLGSRVVPSGAGITFLRAYDESGYAVAYLDANDLVIGGVSNLPLPKYGRVTVLGDSLIHQGMEQLQRVLADRQVTALGAGGRTSTELAAVGCGVPALLTASGNTIQASGVTTVTAWSTSIITNQGAASVTGTWHGVAGTLTATAFDGNGRATAMTFTRTTAGQALTIPANTPFIPAQAVARQSDVWIIGLGRNDGAAAFASGATEANIEAQVKFLGHDRFLIQAVTDRGIAYEAAGSSDYAALMGMLNRLQARFGPRFVDLHRGMIDRGLTIAGLTPTSDDNTDIAADVIPRQLKLSELGGTVFTHFTTAGYYVRAVLTKEAIDRMGW